MSSTLRTNLQYITTSISFLLSQVEPEKVIEDITDHSSLLLPIGGIRKRIYQINEEMAEYKTTDLSSTRVSTLWNELKIEGCCNQFIQEIEKSVNEKQVVTETICKEGYELVEKIKTISVDLFQLTYTEEDQDISFIDFWNNKKLIKKYLKLKNKNVSDWENEIQQSLVYSQSLSTSLLQDKINTVQKKIDEVNLQKSKVFLDLFIPIIKLTTRILTNEYGEEIKKSLLQYSESILNFEAFLRLLLIDLCCFKDANDIKKLVFFNKLQLTQRDVNSLRSLKNKKREQFEKIILERDDESISFLKIHIKNLIEYAYQLDNLALEYGEDLKKLYSAVEDVSPIEESLPVELNTIEHISEDQENTNESALIYQDPELTEVDTIQSDECESEDRDVIDYIMSGEMKLSTALISIVQNVLQPSKDVIKELAVVLWNNCNTKHCINFFDKISDVEVRNCFIQHMCVTSLVHNDVDAYLFFQEALKYYEPHAVEKFFTHVFNLLINEDDEGGKVYELVVQIGPNLGKTVKESCFKALFTWLNTLPEKDLFLAEDHAPYSILEIMQIMQNRSMLEYYRDDELLKKYCEYALYAFQQANKRSYDFSLEKLERDFFVSKETLILPNSIPELFSGLFSEKLVLIQKKEKLFEQVFSPTVSLIAHILMGEYGENIQKRFLQGDFQEKDLKKFFRFLFIHIVRTKQTLPPFLCNLDPNSEKYAEYITFLSEIINEVSLVHLEEMIDANTCEIADSAIKELINANQEIMSESKKLNSAAYSLFLQHPQLVSETTKELLQSSLGQPQGNYGDGISEIDWLDISSDGDSVSSSSSVVKVDSESQQYDTFLRNYGLWEEPNLIINLLQSALNIFRFDLAGIYIQIQNFMKVREEKDLLEFISQIESNNLRIKYIVSYLLFLPIEDVYASLQSIVSQIYKVNIEEINTIFRELFVSVLMHGNNSNQLIVQSDTTFFERIMNGSQRQKWVSKLENVIDLYYLIFQEIYTCEHYLFKKNMRSFSKYALEKLSICSLVDSLVPLKNKLQQFES